MIFSTTLCVVWAMLTICATTRSGIRPRRRLPRFFRRTVELERPRAAEDNVSRQRGSQGSFHQPLLFFRELLNELP